MGGARAKDLRLATGTADRRRRAGNRGPSGQRPEQLLSATTALASTTDSFQSSGTVRVRRNATVTLLARRRGSATMGHGAGRTGAGRAGAVIRSGRMRCDGDAARAEAGLRHYGGDADHRRTATTPPASTPDESPLPPSHGWGTGRRPREHFEAEERAALLPLPTEPYDVPKWCEPKVARDHYAQVGKALYSLPRHFIGRRLLARADKKLVRFYEGATVVKVHPRMKPGQRSTDDSDFPPEKSAAAKRDAEFFIRQAAEHGRVIGDFARALLQGPAPWTRMRRIYKLLGFVKRFGADPVSRACEIALASDMFDLYRLERMIERNTAARLAAASIPTATLPPLPARYLRPPEQFALSLPGMGSGNGLIQLQGGRSYDHNDNPKSDSLRTQDGAQTAQALAAS